MSDVEKYQKLCDQTELERRQVVEVQEKHEKGTLEYRAFAALAADLQVEWDYYYRSMLDARKGR